ncbi:putative leader peptide [Pseudonocardia broussonetiae]
MGIPLKRRRHVDLCRTSAAL